MNRALILICLSLAAAIPSVGLQALGEVGIFTLDSAMTQTHWCLIRGSAISTYMIMVPSSSSNSNVAGYLSGVMLSFKVNPRLALGGSILIGANNLGGDLNAKVLCWQDGPHHLNVKPSLIASQGKVEHGSYATDHCQVMGFSLPVLYSLDTWRNLSLNASAGVNCEWTDFWRTDTDSGETVLEYELSPLLHGQVNINVEATYGVFYLIPEIGICVADGKDQGIKIFGTYGFAIGMKW